MTRALLSLFARVLLAACVILAVIEGAGAHDVLANGEPVPAGIRAACCSVSDAHFLKPEQVHTMPDGWHIDGFDQVLPYGKEEPSPDGAYWLFYATYSDGSHSAVYCWFVPPTGF